MTSPEELDRTIAAAARALRAARRALRASTDLVANPLAVARGVSTRTVYLELAERRDPIARAARAWVRELTLSRVLWADELRLAEARLAESIERDDLDP